jgi:hypothetical protein
MSQPVRPFPHPGRPALDRFRATLVQALSEGHALASALQEAGTVALLSFGDPRPLLNVTAHLVVDFEDASGVRVSTDPLAIERIFEAVLKASAELQSSPEAELNLPFLTADASGPKHLARTLTQREFADLAAKVPRAPKPAPHDPVETIRAELDRHEAEARAAARPKKKWWPF